MRRTHEMSSNELGTAVAQSNQGHDVCESSISRPNVERQSKTHQHKFSGCLTTGGIHVAALSDEQRMPPRLKHCAVNTKAESKALGIRLERFVMLLRFVYISKRLKLLNHI